MMKTALKVSLLLFFALGIILPYHYLLGYISENGVDISAAYHQIILTKLSVFGWIDVIVSAVALFFFAFATRLVSRKQASLVVLATLLVGVSAGLPLFLYFLVGSDRVKL